MTPPELETILQNSCVAVLPQETVTQIMETGAPHTLVYHPTDKKRENPIRLAAWGQMAKKWPGRSTLRVRFLGGDTRQREMTLTRMRTLDNLCPSIAFRHVTGGPSEIRVRFDENSGHWSYVGTDCKRIPQNQQTMNIGLRASQSWKEWDRVALHETLHALGFNHEHQHPRGTIAWDVEAVYAYYGETQGWSRAEVDAQVLRRSTATNIFGSAPDRSSIMMYPIPKELLLDKTQAVGWNTKMSELDISELKRLYA